MRVCTLPPKNKVTLIEVIITLFDPENSYIKAIYNGHIVEFYIMDKSPYGQYDVSPEDDPNRIDYLFSDETINRYEERREQTLRDSKNTMRRLAIRNFGTDSLFITLTYRNEEHLTNKDIDLADGHFRQFIKDLREETGQSVQYLAVREFTKKGRIHFHFLTDFKIDGDLIDPEEVDLKRWERDVAKVWSHGFVDIKLIDHVDNVGAYLSKYMSKGIASDYFKNRKYYLCSQGLIRPEIVTGEVALALYNAMKKENEVYTNSYESEYLGNITYIEYNLNRQNKVSDIV